MESALTSKGQATIPKAIRDHLGLAPSEPIPSGAIDVVKIYDDGASANQTGYLTDIPAADEFGAPITIGSNPLTTANSFCQSLSFSLSRLPCTSS